MGKTVRKPTIAQAEQIEAERDLLVHFWRKLNRLAKILGYLPGVDTVPLTLEMRREIHIAFQAADTAVKEFEPFMRKVQKRKPIIDGKPDTTVFDVERETVYVVMHRVIYEGDDLIGISASIEGCIAIIEADNQLKDRDMGTIRRITNDDGTETLEATTRRGEYYLYVQEVKP